MALCLVFAAQGPAKAQESQGLTDRLNRLERELNTLQSQVYRGGGSSSSSSGGAAALSGDTYSMLDQRINALEGQLRDLTGQIEKTNYTNSQMQSKLERMEKDNDFRFKELEQKAGAGGAPQAGQPAQGGQTTANGAPALTPPNSANKQGDWNPTMGSPPGNLGQIPASDLKKEQQAAAGNAAQPAAKAGTLPGKTPQEQYDYAFGLLRNSDYDGANNAFQLFVQQHPQDPLAGNAVYWLGQIPYSQGDYEKAAPLFLDAYRKYPKSAKAGESLLKVGLAFSNLNKKKEACVAIQRFLSEFPDASDNLRRQASQEKSKLGC
ncbi:MAG TPA: tol-pal system protein YbgF [Candidatus Sulfotelmatobacter sp.]|nr:tol-pal system protein YbgF [Candidatus Sulfotelmatobacter sp.]